MTIAKKFKQILVFCGEADRATGEPESIKLLESMTGQRLPADLTEYFRECIPRSIYAGRWPIFVSAKTALDDLENDPVASHVLALGFVSFANAMDGGQFAYSLHDGGIYSFGVEAVDQTRPEMLNGIADRSWASLLVFLDWNLEHIKLG